MKRLLAVLMMCSVLLLVEGCGKPKATTGTTGQEGVNRPAASRREMRERQKQEKQGGEAKTAPAGETSGAAKQ